MVKSNNIFLKIMGVKIEYKDEGLKINKELKVIGGRYGGLYRIVEYQDSGFKPISGAFTTSFLAWKDCYWKLKKQNKTK